MSKILVTGGGSLCGQGILKCLVGPTHTRIAVDPSPLSVGLQWANSSHLVPIAHEPGYIDAIEEILRTDKPDIVMIGTDVELPIFAQHRERLEAEYGTHILVSAPEVVGIADDKYKTYQFMRDAGFNPPQSCPSHESPDFEFPMVVKPRVGGRSRGMFVAKGPRDMTEYVEQPGYMFQEHIGTPDLEFTAGAIHFGGEVATIVMRRELRDGNTYRAYLEEFSELNAKVREWALALKPHGPANFQFRLDGKGEPRCFEINARFSGTTPFRALAGFNEVEMCADYLLHGRPLRQPKIKPMTILRFWQEMAVPA